MSSFFLVILFLSAAALLPGGAVSTTPVLDADGDELQNGGEYYILPPANMNAGPVTLHPRQSSACPSNVAMSLFGKAIPVRIHSSDSEAETINERKTVSFEFTDAPSCVESRKWALEVEEHGNRETTRVAVKSSDNKENVVQGQFQITGREQQGESSMSYEIRARRSGDQSWEPLGFERDNEFVGYLCLRNRANIRSLAFQFRKAESAIRMVRKMKAM